ncbi:hypothetical protein Tco_0102813, partial [Tanacetum coccineum]
GKGEKEVTTPVNLQTNIRRRSGVSTGSGGVSTASRQDGTADVNVSTTSEIDNTAAEVKAIDKGKAIMTEPEPEKKTKKQLELEILGHEEAVRLQEQIDEEERQRIIRDAKIVRQLHEEFNKVGQERVVAKDQAHDIDWNDPFVIRYRVLQNRPRSIVEVRKNMCIYLKNQGGYKMKDFKGISYDDIRPTFEKRSKRKGQDVEAEPAKRQRTGEVSESAQEQTGEELKIEELSQEQLHQLIITFPEEGIHVEALQTKYLIVDWEIHSNFDREDLLKLCSLVQERFNLSGLTDVKKKELWVELKMLFEPDEETLSELQRYMHDPLKWCVCYSSCIYRERTRYIHAGRKGLSTNKGTCNFDDMQQAKSGSTFRYGL